MDALNTHSNRTKLIDEIKKLMEFTPAESHPEQQESLAYDPWQKLGAAIALNIHWAANQPGYVRTLIEGRGRWWLKRKSDAAQPRSKRRTKLLRQVRIMNQLRRDEKRRAAWREACAKAGLK